MEKKKRLYYALGGFVLGLLTASLIWLHIRPRTNTDIPAGSGGNHADNKKGDPGGLPQTRTKILPTITAQQIFPQKHRIIVR